MLPIYCWTFSLCFTAIFISTLERGHIKYGLGCSGGHILHGLNVFIIASLMFGFISFGNAALCVFLRTGVFVWLQVLAAAVLFAFAGFKELRYKEEARYHRREMLEEMAVLRKGLEKDPANAAYLERLGELYERTGDMKAAAASLERLAGLYEKMRNMGAAEACAEKARKLEQGERELLKGYARLLDPAVSPLFAMAAGYVRFLEARLKSAWRIFRIF